MDGVMGGLIAGMLAKLERVSEFTLMGVARDVRAAGAGFKRAGR
jgi:hypothetical protein